jgi:PHD/YefM family antitoxin component YafN of YafNO toxin-antitoxin module
MDGPIMFPIKRPNGIAMVMISEQEWQANKDPERLSRLLEVRVASAIERADEPTASADVPLRSN